MRRFAAPVLIGLGMFLIVGALLLKFYAYPRLAVVPKDQNSVTELSATGATVFDVTTLQQITTDLSIKATTRGDVKAAENAPDGAVVWVGTQTVKKSDGGIISQSSDITAMDETTAEAVNCCGVAVDVVNGVGTPVVRKGLVFKFPFNTEKKDYQVWDDTLGAAATAKYAGESEILGMKVYKFTMDIPETVVGTREVPASVLGLEGTDLVNADSTYAVQRQIFVEPAIGAIIDRIDDQRAALTYDDAELVTTEAEISYTDAQVKSNVDDYKSKAKLLAGARTTYPLIAGLLGLLALGVGLLLGRSGARRRA